MRPASLTRYTAAMLGERVLVGGAAALAPGALLQAFGIDPDEDSPTLRYFARLFGIRNAVMGVMLWRVRNDPRALSRMAALNAATEALDAIAAAVPLATGRTKPSAAAGAIGASVADGAGFAGLALAARRATTRA
ncbi:MAG: DUF4267 domain-containing protein [Actinomycetota bacterium]